MIDYETTSQVWGICGNLGGGKSLTAVSMLVDALSRGWYVVTNMELNHNALTDYLGYDSRKMVSRVDLDDSDPSSWPSGSPRGSGGKKRVVVVLDEVAEWFDQYSSTSENVRRFLSWLRHSSKRSQDVILIVQRKEYLAKSLRILVARWVFCEDLAVWRVPVLRIRLPFCSGLVMRNVSDRLGNCLKYLDTCSKSFYGKFYSTSQCLARGMSANEYATVLVRDEVSTFDFFTVFCFLLLLVSSAYLMHLYRLFL